MSDVWVVFATLAILYLLEGVWWTPRDAVSFSRGLFGGFTGVHPVLLRREAASGAMLPRHLVATGERFLASGGPKRISPEGLSEIDEEWTASIDRALDHRDARRRARRVGVVLRRSRWLSAVMFANLFVLAPALASLAGAWTWPLPAALHVGLSSAAAVVFYRASARLSTGRVEDRFSPILTMLLYPPAAARFAERLSRNLMIDLHPMAVAAALDRVTLESLARRAVLESRKRTTEENEGVARSRRVQAERMSKAVERYGLDVRALARAPEPEPGAVAYCPLCHAQYRSSLSDCVDCEGIALVPHGAG